jgi:hypothetical protein
MAPESESKTAVTLPAPPSSAGSGNSLASDPELLTDFVLESREHLTSIELQLLCHCVDKLLNLRGGTDILVCVSAPFNPFSATC